MKATETDALVRRARCLGGRAEMLAKVLGPSHPGTIAALARRRAAAGLQPRPGASVAELRAWNREAGDLGTGNRASRRRRIEVGRTIVGAAVVTTRKAA